MFEQLRRIFVDPNPLESLGDRFLEMLTLVQWMIGTASAAYWGTHLTPEERQRIYDTDIRVNQLQRSIRQRLVLHLSTSTHADVPYGLLLMSLVKDAERLGDYAKNLIEVHELCDRGAGDLPEGRLQVGLRRIATFVEQLSMEVLRVYEHDDKERARQLSTEGRKIARECEELISEVAASDLTAATAVDLALATRFYKRIIGHWLNLLSSLLMPLHELDYQSRE